MQHHEGLGQFQRVLGVAQDPWRSTSTSSAALLVRTIREAPPRKAMTAARTLPARVSQASTECTWVIAGRSRFHRGAAASPPCGPVPVTTVPATRSRKPTTTSPMLTACSMGPTASWGLPSGSWRRTYSATVMKTITMDSRKWVATAAGCRLLQTVMPPTTA